MKKFFKNVKKKRTGFTLVELLVVIAILAVLASVSVIGYLSFIKKARVSNDVSLTTQMNTVLASNEVVDGKNATPHDAISELDEDGGFDVNKISPTANGYFFGFDTTDNRMVLFDEGMNVVAPEGKNVSDHKRDVFLLVGTEDEMKESKYSAYSFYLKNGFVESGDNVINVSTGVDTGTNEIGTVNYENTTSTIKDVLIRSNGGTVTIKDSTNSKISHYGNAEIVDAQEVAYESLHEYGSVELVKIKKGHVELEKGSDVNGVYIYNETQYDEDGTATSIGNSFENIKITLKDGVDQPKLSRSAVTIDSTTGTKVCTFVTSSSSNDYYLFMQGVYEQVKVVETGKEITDASAKWADTTNNDSIETAAHQIANDINSGYTYEVKNKDNRTIEVKDSTGNVVTDTKDAISNGSTPEQAADNCLVKGSGTETDPFIIYNYKTFQKITDITLSTDRFNYFKVAIEKTNNGTIDCTDWSPVKLYGSIDGCGVVMENLDNVLFNWTYNDRNSDGTAINTCTISNMTLNCNIFSTSSVASLVRTAADDLVVENVNVTGQIVGYSVGGYIDYGSGNWGSVSTRNWQVTFKNCINSANLVSYAEGIGGFVQHPYCDATNIPSGKTYNDTKSCITIIDSIYNGKMTSISTNMDYFAYQGNNVRVKESYSSSFIAKFGEISGVLHNVCTPDANGYINCGNYSTVVDTYRPNDSDNSAYKLKLSSTKGNLPSTLGDTYILTKAAGATIVKVAYMINPNDAETESGSYTGTYLNETIDISSIGAGNTFNTSVVKYCTAVINGDGVTSQGLSADGTTYNVYDGGRFYGHTHNGANVYAIQYDSNGAIVGITQFVVEGSNAVGVRVNGQMVLSAGAGNSYTYDSGMDLTNYNVSIKIYSRTVNTWCWDYTDDAIYKTLSCDTDYSINGTKIIIKNIEKIPLTNDALYDYFHENCRYVIEFTKN